MRFPPARFDDDVRAHLDRVGDVFAVRDAATQDSGNVAYGVRVDGADWFVKTAGLVDEPTPQDFAQRVALLENAARVASSVAHPALPAPTLLVPAGRQGPVLVRPWLPGEVLHVPLERRGGPGNARDRFLALPLPDAVAALSTVVDAHVALAAAGWVAGDLYLGCLLHDVDTGRIALVDLDEYHCGPVVNRVGEMTGSRTVMSPEERTLGAVVDQRSTVFTLSRIALVLLGDGSGDPGRFRAGDPLLAVLRRATSARPDDRHPDVATFAAAWAAAVSSSPPAPAT